MELLDVDGIKKMMRDKFNAQSDPTWTEKIDHGNGIICYRNVLDYRDWETDRKSTRLNSIHSRASRMPSSA